MIKKIAFLWVLLLCLLAMAFASADGTPSAQLLSSRYGDQGPHVRLLQEELARLGYYYGEPDGRYDKQTVNAVEQFQKERGLPLDGQAGGMTLLALFAQIAFNRPLADFGSQTAMDEPAIERTQSIPQESDPGERGSHVKQLQQALVSLNYLPFEAVDGVFSDETLKAVIAFQKDNGLRETGKADRDTLQVMFVKPRNVPGITQMLYWYSGGSSRIPVGAIFEVMDVRTGIKFTCRRLCGVSHLDAEPLTSFDTLAMKEAYGGDWSWDRRPILLNYQSEVYAASMNGMPHSWQSISTNHMDGHFCIHFFESRIDTSQRVDANHLQCVFEASFACWEDMTKAEELP
jgi:peptidoglycan hydrolase-like protein with peptidoglycan-binding domain